MTRHPLKNSLKAHTPFCACLISGNQISHSHRLTRRVWKPNLQVTTLVVNGSPIKVKVCARTLKTLKGASEVEVMRILKANIATLSERLLKHLNK